MGIKDDFKNIKNKSDLALFLNVDIKELNFLLYAKKNKNYTKFQIPKKDGSYRDIYSPNRQLKYIQKKLLNVFYEFYNDNNNVYGFLKNKSIVANSRRHISKSCVINIDLKDFFPSITFYRINGLLQKTPFNLNRDISIIIANLLTHNNMLPQGAPTSPILSNFICRSLDIQLTKYAKFHDAVYTRYADDITFSVNNNTNVKYFIDEIDDASVNKDLKLIIERNGFVINEKKVRKSYKESHQEVTGIVVNSKPNINYNYYYRLRSMIHAWEKFGLEAAAKKHCEKFNILYNVSSLSHYKNKIIGMLNYLKMVCGQKDLRYIKLATRVNKICQKHILSIDYDYYSLYLNCVYIISDSEKIENGYGFGTAFKLKDFYVTCKHCIYEENEEVTPQEKEAYIFKNNESVGTKINILYVSSFNDFVIFDVPNYYFPYYFEVYEDKLKVGDQVIAIGFPDYERGDNTSAIRASITNDRRIKGEKTTYWVLDRQIQPGLSGGPIIESKNNRVAGIVVYGCTSIYDSETKNAFLPIKTILDEYKNRSN